MAKSDKNDKSSLTPENGRNGSITIDGEEFSIEGASDVAKQALNSLRFAENKIAQLRGEMSLATTARTGFINILKNEFKK